METCEWCRNAFWLNAYRLIQFGEAFQGWPERTMNDKKLRFRRWIAPYDYAGRFWFSFHKDVRYLKCVDKLQLEIEFVILRRWSNLFLKYMYLRQTLKQIEKKTKQFNVFHGSFGILPYEIGFQSCPFVKRIGCTIKF